MGTFQADDIFDCCIILVPLVIPITKIPITKITTESSIKENPNFTWLTVVLFVKNQKINLIKFSQ